MHRPRQSLVALLTSALAGAAHAQPAPSPAVPSTPPAAIATGDGARPGTRSLADLYFDQNDPELSPQERAALAIALRWREANTATRPPVVGPDGSLRYLFGAQPVTIVCAVLQICDIALQPGERVNDVRVGDRGGWEVAPAVSGQGAQQIVHLVLKPHDVGLDTAMMVTTNRRTYHFRLRSHRREFMARVSFEYPEDTAALWDTLRQRLGDLQRDRVLPETAASGGPTTRAASGTIGLVDALDFGYSIEGKAPWKPLRVYNDGVRTVIQMPVAMRHTEAPVLLLVRPEGRVGDDADHVLVNYRLEGDRFIVDAVVEQAVLLAGVGDRQSRVTIERSR